ncbi:MAG: nicotinamide-nucleotide adenylyltransferase [Thermoprotei archaeon]|nr:MAG: nicotinamide-nucleotide adenylyltransferase [Thermoprotei archaeon]RLF25690.1 MAG: nicotinamide-nucleotide adenylyltransferase [Thermoprotei archaeon]
MTRGFFIGRFQPFHLGHLKALEWILGKVNEVIIGIGSAQYSHSLQNPFTAGERVEMIWRVLRTRGLLSRCIITLVPDTNGRHSIWVAMVEHYSPRFDIVFSNDPLTQRLFKEAGYRVEGIPFFKRDLYNATRIRKLMLRGDEWKEYVPKEVAEYIEEIDGVNRLREIYLRLQQ